MPAQPRLKLADQLVLVVGGSSGLGLAVAREALALGAHVVIASSKQASVDSGVQSLLAFHFADSPEEGKVAVRGTTIDLGAKDLEQQVIALYKFATNDGARKLDHVVITSGDTLFPKPLDQINTDDFGAASQVRIVGPLILAKHALTYINKSPRSSFTLTSGIRDIRPVPTFSALAPISAAVKTLARCLAVELQPIRANSVSPGAVKTGLFIKMAGEHADAVLAQLAEQTLTKTNGTPEGIADVYASILTSAYINGTDVGADGGALLV